MTNAEKMNAYEATKNRFNLKWRQRDALDASAEYEAIMIAAHLGKWNIAEQLLQQAGII